MSSTQVGSNLDIISFETVILLEVYVVVVVLYWNYLLKARGLLRVHKISSPFALNCPPYFVD
uniref:Uncharacterized protein n=1 Tax=Arundo donax TaxID=35708 RepID=A0A0A9CCL8_ARUDO